MKTLKQTNILIFAVPALLLAAAFFCNLFVEGFNWSLPDFIIAGILLFGTAFVINLVVHSQKTLLFKLIISGIVLLILLLIWIELAVGIFGSPFAGS
ncbi:hypothetical protein PFY12_11910 [Chryseobacterium camelliae]|uniref:Uncharacterized protein n=1 Tax=Chryseobacterium camelliae TaxID=1265445 RepID=A0ABY7QJC0_9FLAO|nr:hypothetical protein [Chryseobacterium camelliae]WBV59762.1 hypothetical protein PFY12_11910 [Chryseobacterium camelliae]